MKSLTVLQVKVGQEPEVVTVAHTTETMQQMVGGWIETVFIADDILMVVNEEGKLQDLPVNFLTLVMEDGKPVPIDTIAGDVFFVSTLGSDFHSMDKEQIQKVKKMFRPERKVCIVAVR